MPPSLTWKKDKFYDELRPVVAEILIAEFLILLGDWNGTRASLVLDRSQCLADMT